MFLMFNYLKNNSLQLLSLCHFISLLGKCSSNHWINFGVVNRAKFFKVRLPPHHRPRRWIISILLFWIRPFWQLHHTKNYRGILPQIRLFYSHQLGKEWQKINLAWYHKKIIWYNIIKKTSRLMPQSDWGLLHFFLGIFTAKKRRREKVRFSSLALVLLCQS